MCGGWVCLLGRVLLVYALLVALDVGGELH